jgi:CRP/FNR family transcriptional regulator, anaerobic regulatory protein
MATPNNEDFTRQLNAWVQENLLPHTYKVEKGEYLTRTGEVENRIYYIVKGAVKVAIMASGEERILDFWFAPSFFSSYTSFLQRTPSKVYIQTLDHCEVAHISYETIQKSYESSLFFNQVGRVMAERLFILKTQREIDFLTKTAEQRYQELFNASPEIIQNISVHQIARYLGIHPESLSRIRKKLFS